MRWEVKPLGEVCDFVRGPFGGSLKKNCFVESGYAVYEQKHPIHGDFSSFRYFIKSEKFEEMRRFEVEPGNVLMSCSGTIGRTKVVPKGAPKGIINQALLNLKPKDGLIPLFLKKWMDSSHFLVQIEQRSAGAALKNVASVKKLKAIEFPFPPIEEQERIVAVLDDAFAAIDKAKGNIERNLTNARELFQSRLNDIFSNPSEDWEVKPLEEVFELENGDRGKNYPKPTDLTDDGVPWVNAGDLREGVCEVTTAKHITTSAFDKLSRGKFKGGDVLFCLRGSLGKFGQVRNGDFGAIASSLVIIKASSSLDSRYLSQWLNCRSCKNQIDEYAGGAAQPNLGAKDLGRFRFPLPSHEKKSTIVEHLELMGNEVKMLEAKYRTELDNLEELRQSILEQAFEGKLTEPVAA